MQRIEDRLAVSGDGGWRPAVWRAEVSSPTWLLEDAQGKLSVLPNRNVMIATTHQVVTKALSEDWSSVTEIHWPLPDPGVGDLVIEPCGLDRKSFVGEPLAGLGQGQDVRVVERDLWQRGTAFSSRESQGWSARFVLGGCGGALSIGEGLVDDADGDFDTGGNGADDSPRWRRARMAARLSSPTTGRRPPTRPRLRAASRLFLVSRVMSRRRSVSRKKESAVPNNYPPEFRRQMVELVRAGLWSWTSRTASARGTPAASSCKPTATRSAASARALPPTSASPPPSWARPSSVERRWPHSPPADVLQNSGPAL